MKDHALGIARRRAEPSRIMLTSNNIADLLIESINLAKLVATEQRDISAIKLAHEQRLAEINCMHERAVLLISEEYKERSEQVKLLHENIKILIEMEQFTIAQQIMNRIVDILADSPLKTAMRFR